MKNNKILIIITIILGILVILMGSYIIYDNFIQKDNDIQNNNKDSQNNNQNTSNNISENNIEKLDNNKDWVYDADYNLPTDKESYYGYVDHSKLISASDLIVPYINIDSTDAKKVNQEIYNLYEELIDTFNNNLKNEIWFTLVEYKTYTNNNILSIVITTERAGTDVAIYEYYTYNFNLDNGGLSSYEEIYKSKGFTQNNISDKAIQSITNAMKKAYHIETDFDAYNNKSINNYKTSVDNDTIKFFIDENNKLNIIVTLNIPAGRGAFDTIITIE